MSTSAKQEVVGAVGVRFTVTMLVVALSDGREIGVPLERLPWLSKASPETRARWSLDPDGVGIWWDDLDEGLEVMHLLALAPLTTKAHNGKTKTPAQGREFSMEALLSCFRVMRIPLQRPAQPLAEVHDRFIPHQLAGS